MGRMAWVWVCEGKAGGISMLLLFCQFIDIYAVNLIRTLTKMG